jgi:hypothetical protein
VVSAPDPYEFAASLSDRRRHKSFDGGVHGSHPTATSSMAGFKEVKTLYASIRLLPKRRLTHPRAGHLMCLDRLEIPDYSFSKGDSTCSRRVLAVFGGSL